jgi:hypothetical protein
MLEKYWKLYKTSSPEVRDLFEKVEDDMETETEIVCVCGYLATGLHTSTCDKYHHVLRKRVVKSAEKAGLV